MNKYRDLTLPQLHDRAIELVNRHSPHGLNYAERAAWLAGYDKELSEEIVRGEKFFPYLRSKGRAVAFSGAPRKAGVR